MSRIYSYVSEGVDGRSYREESSDGTGVVRGQYSISGADGIQRIVHYIADENGFRATVQTNEPGTESQSPANVLFESSQPAAEELARQYGPQYTAAAQQRQLARVNLQPQRVELQPVVPLPQAPIQVFEKFGQYD